MTSRRFTLMVATVCSVVVAGCTMCRDERPPIDDHVATYGKRLGDERAARPSAADERRDARRRFVASSQVQLAALAIELEGRGRMANVPIERIESLRKDYWHLVELRRQVLEAPEETFDDAMDQFQVQVDTMREQFARLDRGLLP